MGPSAPISSPEFSFLTDNPLQHPPPKVGKATCYSVN